MLYLTTKIATALSKKKHNYTTIVYQENQAKRASPHSYSHGPYTIPITII